MLLVPTFSGCPGKKAIKWVPVCLASCLLREFRTVFCEPDAFLDTQLPTNSICLCSKDVDHTVSELVFSVLKVCVSRWFWRTSMPADEAQFQWRWLGLVWATDQVRRQPHKPGADDDSGQWTYTLPGTTDGTRRRYHVQDIPAHVPHFCVLLSISYMWQIWGTISNSSFRQWLHSPDATDTKFGERAFYVSSLLHWNSLPETVRAATDLRSFKNNLKLLPMFEQVSTGLYFFGCITCIVRLCINAVYCCIAAWSVCLSVCLFVCLSVCLFDSLVSSAKCCLG